MDSCKNDDILQMFLLSTRSKCCRLSVGLTLETSHQIVIAMMQHFVGNGPAIRGTEI